MKFQFQLKIDDGKPLLSVYIIYIYNDVKKCFSLPMEIEFNLKLICWTRVQI